MSLNVGSHSLVKLDSLQDDNDAYLNSATLTFSIYRVLAGQCSIAAGDATLTIDEAEFVAADVGKAIIVPGAAEDGGDLRTTIATFTNGTEVELTVGADLAVSDVQVEVSLAVDVTMSYVAASNGNYKGTYNDTTGKNLHNGRRYIVEYKIVNSGNTQYRRREEIAVYPK
jgi:hypothetical protein